MKRIVFCVFIITCSVSTIKAQLKPGDKLIGAEAYKSLAAYRERYEAQSLEMARIKYQMDSLARVLRLAVRSGDDYRERALAAEAENAALVEENRKATLRASGYKTQLGDWKYKYTQSPRYKDKADNMMVLAMVMAGAFFMNLSDNDKVKNVTSVAAITGAGVALYLGVTLNRPKKKEP